MDALVESQRHVVDLRDAPISIDEAVAAVANSSAGGIAVFVGVVRDTNEGRAVARLEYKAYESMAKAELRRIAREVSARWPDVRVAALHRIGSLSVGETAVACAASAPHRGEAFEACRALIEAIKARVPIWKREHGPDGATWVGWVDARCADHEHHHG
jgi:molybdopterin synthase catalytic subunit